MTELFKRRATVVVGSLTFSCGTDATGVRGLDIEFDVKKTLRATPNTCELKIYNLTAEHRAELSQRRRATERNALVIQAGYDDDDFLIFAGDIIECETERVGPDYITVFSAGDGHRARRTARIAEPVAEGTTPQGIIRQASHAMGDALHISRATIDSVIDRIIPPSTTFAGGASAVRTSSVLSGNAMSELTRVSRSAGYEVSIQDGNLQFVRIGEATTDVAFRLAPDSGVVKAPIRKTNGIVEARTLLIPDLLPGRKVQFDGYEVQGTFRVESAKYTGSTSGAEWFIDVECKEL